MILVLAHSQGSVVVADVLPGLLEERPQLAQRIRLITLGSPLHTLYFKLFGLFEEIAIPPESRWMNLYRSGDYIGGAISAESCKENRPIGPGGHTHYWSDDRVHQAIDEQLGRSAPAERAGRGA